MDLVKWNMTAILLAGGKSRRFGNNDKGLQKISGRLFAELMLERVSPLVDEVLISANRHVDRYSLLGPEAFKDEIPDFSGPLAGLHAGMGRAKHDWVVTVPCDSPLFPQTLVAQFIEELGKSDAWIAIAKSGPRTYPVFMMCPTQLREDLDEYLRSGGRRIETWYERHPHLIVDFDNDKAFTNINEPNDIRQMEIMLRR